SVYSIQLEEQPNRVCAHKGTCRPAFLAPFAGFFRSGALASALRAGFSASIDRRSTSMRLTTFVVGAASGSRLIGMPACLRFSISTTASAPRRRWLAHRGDLSMLRRDKALSLSVQRAGPVDNSPPAQFLIRIGDSLAACDMACSMLRAMIGRSLLPAGQPA